MSRSNAAPFSEDPDDPLESIRENAEAVRRVGEKRDDETGALARVLYNVAHGEEPVPEDCEQAGLESLLEVID